MARRRWTVRAWCGCWTSTPSWSRSTPTWCRRGRVSTLRVRGSLGRDVHRPMGRRICESTVLRRLPGELGGSRHLFGQRCLDPAQPLLEAGHDAEPDTDPAVLCPNVLEQVA